MSQTVASGAGRPLSSGEAGSRLATVLLIQTLGVVFVLGPLIKPGFSADDWQRSCLLFGTLSAIGWLLLFAMFWVAAKRAFKKEEFNTRQTEVMISVAFVLNTVALSLAMTRTGGPASSSFGQMIVMQLSGILLLEQQKEAFTSRHTFWPLAYPILTLLFWGSAVLFWRHLAARMGWSTTVVGYAFLSPSILILCEIVLMAVAYFLPRTFSSANTKPNTKEALRHS
jgi:hypothetical protein